MRIASLVVLVLAVLLSGSSAAMANDARLGLSRDGVTWTPSITTPLFDPDLRWVPGDVQVRSFFVRNQSAEAAQMSVDVLGSTTDALISTGDLEMSARSGSGPWTQVASTGSHRLVTWIPTNAGDVSQVDVRVRFRADSTNQSQRLPYDMNFRVTLRQASPVDPTPAPTSTPTNGGGAVSPEVVQPDQSGGLPDTGAPVFWTLFVAMALVVAGLIVTPWRRDQEEEISDV